MKEIKVDKRISGFIKFFAQSETRLLTLLVFASFLVRVIVMVYSRTYQFPNERSLGYEMGWIAQNLVDGEGFRVGNYYAWMAPLYPFMLSLIFRVFGSYTISSTIAILLMQSILSSLVVIPLYYIGKRLFDKRVGFIAALLWIFNPDGIYYAVNFVWSSSFTTLGLVLVVLIFLRLADKPAHTLDPFLGGLVIGIVALSNPVVLTFIPFAMLWLLWRSQNGFKKTIAQLTVIGLMAVIILLPWTLRNYQIFHQFVPVKSTFGVNLWQGNYGYGINQRTAGLDFDNKLKGFYSEQEITYLLSLNEAERDNALRNMTVEFIGENPGTFIQYTIQRIYIFWRTTISGPGTALDMLLLTLIPLTLLGISYSWRRWHDTALLLLLFITYPIVFYITHADFNRFRFPIEALMLVFAAHAAYTMLRLARPKRVLRRFGIRK